MARSTPSPKARSPPAHFRPRRRQLRDPRHAHCPAHRQWCDGREGDRVAPGQDRRAAPGPAQPDLTTARRIAAAVNRAIDGVARATDPRTVALDFSGRVSFKTPATTEAL